MQEKKQITIHTRVPADLKEAVKSAAKHCGYMNESDFLRDAAREKIKRDLGKDDFVLRANRPADNNLANVAEVEKRILMCFPTENGIYSKQQIEDIKLQIQGILHEDMFKNVIQRTFDKLPFIEYTGRAFKITSNGSYNNTVITIDGVNPKVRSLILKIFPNRAVTVDMEVLDL